MNGDKQPWQHVFSSTVFTVLSKIGCLTFVISVTALLLGIWLDGQLGTRPWMTVILVGLSVPIVTALIIKVTLSGTKHLNTSTPSKKPKLNETKEEKNREPSSEA
jgi:hypothetical protein